MAHELSFTGDTADFFELGEFRTAWHEEGHLLPIGTPFDEALAAGQLLYPVVKRPVYLQTPDGAFKPCTTGAVTVRADRDLELGVVGSDYAVIQNVEAFGLVKPLVESGALRLETGGVLRDGADAWVLAQINLSAFPSEVAEALHREQIAKYLLVRTNHTGRANASVTETDVRVVCANTLGMVEGGAYRTQAAVQHRGDASTRLAVAFDVVLGGVIQRTKDFLARYQALQALTLSPGDWQARVMDVVQRDPRTLADFNTTSPFADSVVARYETKRTALLTLWTEGRGHTGDLSAWEAYNGVAEAVDHRPELFPVRASRVRQLMPGGRLYGIKDAVYRSLLPDEETADQN